MSFSYDISLGLTRDRLRFLISDSEASSVIFQDEELDGILNNVEPNLFFAAALCIKSRMASFVTKAIKYRIGATGGTSAIEIDRTGIIKNFTMLAEQYQMWAASQIDESFDRYAFGIDAYGRNRSEYQGMTDDLNSSEDGLGVVPDFA